MKNQIGNYIKHILHLTPSRIKSFGKSYIIPKDYSNLKNKKRFVVFLTKTQIKKLDKAKVNKVKHNLKKVNKIKLHLLLKNKIEENKKNKTQT